MTELRKTDFLVEVAKGNVAGHSIVHKFGANTALSNSLAVISTTGTYETPTSAQSLEFVSSATTDALNSTGMHELTVVGLDASWNEQTVTTAAHATDGTTAVAISGTWMRVYRAWVSKSGAYATASSGSHVGTITIRVSGGGTTYAQIPLSNSFPVGQSLIAAYTVPAGKTAYILSQTISSDVSGTKTTDFYFFKRENANDTASSYDGTMRVQNLFAGTQKQFFRKHETTDSFPEYTDMGFLGITDSGTFNASAEFELLLVDN